MSNNLTYKRYDYFLFFLIFMLYNCDKSHSDTPITSENKDEQSKSYELSYEKSISLPVNIEGKLEIRVKALNQFHINKEYPVKFELLQLEGEGEIIGGDTLNNSNAQIPEDNLLIFVIPFKVKRVGNTKFKGLFKFSLCSENSCIMPKEIIEWEVISVRTDQ